MANGSLPNPFLALRSFKREDARRFFGRDSDLVLVQSRLYSARTTLLFAASGVGKTSFLEAKLAPAIEDDWDIVSHRAWATRPPLEALQASCAAINPALGLGALPLFDQVQRLIGASDGTRGCLVVLDQFEEVFQHWRDSTALDRFAGEIARLVHAPNIPARVLLSMREEFLGELSLFDNLIPDLFNNCYRLKNATRAEADEIITRTAALVRDTECGDGLDPLIDDLVQAAARVTPSPHAEPSPRSRVPMPFLQIVCYRLWDRQMTGGVGTAAKPRRFLDALPGPVRVELEAYCREKLQAMTVKEQDLAAAAFGFLMTPSGAKMAYPVDVLAELARVPEKPLQGVLEQLAGEDVRILRDIPAGPGAKPWFELYHDLYARFLSDWKRDRDATHNAQQRRRTGAAVAGIVLASALALGLIAWWRVANEENRLVAGQLAQVAVTQKTRDGQHTPLSIRLVLESFVRDRAQALPALREALGSALIETARVPLPRAEQIAVSPDGQVLCAVGADGVLLTRLPGNAPIGLAARDALVSAVAFSPDGANVAAAALDGRLQIISTATALASRTIDVMPGGILRAVTYSPSGRLIAVGADDEVQYMAQVYAVADGRLVATTAHKGPVSVLTFSPDDRYLLSGSDDATARLIDLESGQQTVFYHQTRVVAAAFKSDSQRVATSSSDGIAQLTSVPSGATTLLPGLNSGATNALAFSPQGQYLATGQGLLFHLPGLEREPLDTSGSVNLLAFSADDRVVAAAGNDGAYVIGVSPRQLLAHLSPGEAVRTLALRPRGDWMAIRVDDTLRIFRLRPPGAPLPSDDDLEAEACRLAGAIEPAEIARFLAAEPVLGCRVR